MSGGPPAPATVRITASDAAPRHRGWRTALVALVVLALAGTVTLVAFTPDDGAGAPDAGATAPAPAEELRLGYFGNVTHAPALVGVQEGLLAEALQGTGTRLSTEVFNAGPSAVEALNAGAIDAAFLGPNPAVNSFAQSGGSSVVVVAGATVGGAQLVVRPEITDIAGLDGTVLATPQLGGTQDVALRSFLAEHGLGGSPGADARVDVNPTANAQTLTLFQNGELDGAWLPEPWSSRLVLEAGAEVLVDEAELWDGSLAGDPGQFTTTILVVNRDFAAAHPQTVEALLRGHVESLHWLEDASEDERLASIDAALERAAGQTLRRDVLERSLEHLEFTADPLAGTFPTLLQDGVDAGLSQPADLAGLFDLRPLNRVLAESGAPEPVGAAGLGTDGPGTDGEESP